MKKLNKQGFTLIEVVVVMAIIAVLAVLIIGAITVARNSSKETANRSNARTMQAGLEAYYSANKNYPTISSSAYTANTGTAANKVNVTLVSGGACTGGGGTITSSASAYTLVVYKANCSDTLDTITGP